MEIRVGFEIFLPVQFSPLKRQKATGRIEDDKKRDRQKRRYVIYYGNHIEQIPRRQEDTRMYYRITGELYDDDGTLLTKSVNEAKELPNRCETKSMEGFLAAFDVFEQKGLDLDEKVRKQMQKDYSEALLKKQNLKPKEFGKTE